MFGFERDGVSVVLYNASGNLTGRLQLSGDSDFLNHTFNLSSFSDGVYKISVNATDSGNLSGITNRTFIIDNNPPEINVISPSENSVLRDRITINVSANDLGSGIKNVSFGVHDSSFNVVRDGILNLGSGNSRAGFWNATLDATVLSDGDYNIRALAFDNSNKSTFSGNVTFRIFNPPPPSSDDDDDDDGGSRRRSSGGSSGGGGGSSRSSPRNPPPVTTEKPSENKTENNKPADNETIVLVPEKNETKKNETGAETIVPPVPVTDEGKGSSFWNWFLWVLVAIVVLVILAVSLRRRNARKKTR